jgi:hypothetical protein
MAHKADEAVIFVFAQSIEQQSGIHDKRHPDYAWQDKINLAWEGISHETWEYRITLHCFETIQAPQFKLS